MIYWICGAIIELKLGYFELLWHGLHNFFGERRFIHHFKIVSSFGLPVLQDFDLIAHLLEFMVEVCLPPRNSVIDMEKDHCDLS